MINASNYYRTVQSVDFKKLPIVLVKSHDYVNLLTKNGENWDMYHSNASIKNTVDLYFEKLETYLNKNKPSSNTLRVKSKSRVKKIVQKLSTEKTADKKLIKSKTKNNRFKKSKFKVVDKLDIEIYFIKRFLALDSLIKTKKQLLSFLSDLQKAILEKRIRKSSPYADEINNIQHQLINTVSKMGNAIKVEMTKDTLLRLHGHVKEKSIDPAIKLIKRYINLQGQSYINLKVKRLAQHIDNAIQSKVISPRHIHYDTLKKIMNRLKKLGLDPRSDEVLKIDSFDLRGLRGIVG